MFTTPKTKTGTVDFATKEQKAQYMTDQAIRDAQLPGVQRWATVFRTLPESERATAILRFVQFAIEYIRDPGEEWLEDADVTLIRGYGDCDAKERLFVALCVATGIPAMGVPVFKGERFPHEAAAVFLPVRVDARRVLRAWVPADPTVQNSAIGAVPPYRQAQTNHW